MARAGRGRRIAGGRRGAGAPRVQRWQCPRPESGRATASALERSDTTGRKLERSRSRSRGRSLRQAIRALRASPAFTVVSLLVLALGIGATTAIFSVVDAVVLRGLPFEDADRLVAVGERSAASPGGPGQTKAPTAAGPKRAGGEFFVAPAFGAGDFEALSRVKPQNWLDWVAQQSVFESMTAIATAEVTLLPRGGGPEDLSALRTTASFFDVFRIRPALGRAYAVEEEEDGRHRVAILSHALWQRRFNADLAIVGQSISLDDGAYEVIGVMAPHRHLSRRHLPANGRCGCRTSVPLTERTRGRGVVDLPAGCCPGESRRRLSNRRRPR